MKHLFHIIGSIIGDIVIVAILVFPTMLFWGAFMSPLFGFAALTIWQALCINFLALMVARIITWNEV